MNYDQNLTYLAQDAGDIGYATDSNFLEQLPFWIEAAENRILRDLDLLNVYTDDDQGRLSANRRLFTLPTTGGTFEVLSTIRVVLPGPPAATQPALTPISREALDALYPNDAAVGNPSVPRYWAPYNQLQIMVGPAPDVPYQVICFGTKFPATLSPSNPTTFLSEQYPELLHAAEMVEVLAWQRQFSGVAEEQAGAVNWEYLYKQLEANTDINVARMRLASAGWGSRQTQPQSTPPQT